MKKKELESLKKKTVKELSDLESKKRQEIMTAKVEAMSGKATNNRAVRNLRHELAQILTIKTIISRSQKNDEEVEETKETKNK